MIIFRSRFAAVLIAIAMLVASTGPAWAAGVRTGFLASNPQIFPVGDLVDLESIEGSEDFDWDTLPDIVFFEIFESSAAELDEDVILHVNLRFGTAELIDYWSSAFPLRNWIESPIGSNGYFTNRQLGRLKDQASEWLNENDVIPSSYAETDEFLSVLDGSLVSAGIAVIRIDLYSVDENLGGDNTGRLLATQTQTIQVYNPGIPQLQQPAEGEQISGYPIFFAWNWSGGTLLPSDVTLVVVEGNRNSDAESIMQSRNSANTRFEGIPQFGTSHTYTGLAGMEEALEEGKTYYWQVLVNAGTAVPGDYRTYESNIYSFVFTSEPGTGGGDTGSGYTDPIVQQLQSFLPPELMAQITQELEGYEMDDILIDGVGGYQLQDLMQILAGLDPSLLSISVE